jgi:gamma-glutamylcyclotransferase (GGCT)/AIG2-like uncharacterized protein YtfP|tara:strand:- start:5081 stop:5455 length:375 start_codon:yes stop_codon:yes gene_type:complete
MDKLAVYGTLRNGKRDTYRVKDVSLVFPGHKNYPALIKNKEGSGAVVELIDVNDYDLTSYDNYEGIKTGLYVREKIDVYDNDDLKTKAWIYIAGPVLMQNKLVFEEVPEQDWLNKKTKKMLNLI